MKDKDRHSKIIRDIRSARSLALDLKELSEQVMQGDRAALSQAITLVESSLPNDRIKAQELLQILQPHAGKSLRIGISGVPGAGKSTFIEAFGVWLLNQQHRVAVLAVDPSSETGKGSILGDKTRMNELASRKEAFIRPSPSAGNLGGVARKTREAVFLCEAAGFDIVLVETVGVGQNETAVHNMVDVFMLIAVAGTGDELQGIKRGITELADIVLINKADGNNLPMAKAARQDMLRAFQLLPQKASGWKPVAELCSSLEKTGLQEVWKQLQAFHQHALKTGYFDSNRVNQLENWLNDILKDELWNQFISNALVQEKYPRWCDQVKQGKSPAGKAAEELLKLFRSINP